mmetsp:Transcript_72757/g.165099  ORF Transcript_72757/g.165099 Transcript_72757/m.165099 type:complete len:111 (+) Transcript_72757:73-405(+)
MPSSMRSRTTMPKEAYHFPIASYTGHRPTWYRGLPQMRIDAEAERATGSRPSTGRSRSEPALPRMGDHDLPPNMRAGAYAMPGAPTQEKFRPSAHAPPGYTGHKPSFWNP